MRSFMIHLGTPLQFQRRIFSFMMVAGVALLALNPLCASAEENPARRTLRFPADISVGTLLWRMPADKPSVYSMYGSEWSPIGKTRGSVRVPAEALVRLDVSKAASADLAWLDDLGPNDIQAINLQYTDVNDDALHHLTRLTGLRSLDLRQIRITDAGLEGFESLVNVEEIELDAIGVNRDGFGVGDVAMRALGQLHKLRRLNLRCAKVTDLGLAQLVQCGSLTELVLAGTEVSDAGLRHLVKLPRLESLSLGFHGTGANFTNDGLETVGKLVNLTTLDLSGTKITGKGLARLKNLKNLKTLHLESTQVSDADLAYLEPLQNIEWLSLYAEHGTTDVAARNLARLKSLSHLNAHFHVTDKGVASLASLPHLELLILNGDETTDASAEYIAQMESLKSLSFEDCPITDAMLQVIADLPDLEHLTLSRTRISWDGFRHLRRARKLSDLFVNFDPADGQAPAGQPHPNLREIGKLARIKRLAIWGRSLVGADLKDIAGLEGLEYLQLNMPVDDEGALELARLKRLQGLRIEGGVVTDVGLKHLPRLSRLRFLEIEGSFTDAGLLELAHLDELYYLRARSPNVTDAGLQAIARELPALRNASR